jgi:MSHA biogenesis protein MshN
MSLLNDMLRDLSHHKPVPDGKEGYDRQLLNSASFSRKKNLPWGSLAALFIIVFVVVLAINYVLHETVFNGKSNDGFNSKLNDGPASSENSAPILHQTPDVVVPDVMPASQRVEQLTSDETGEVEGTSVTKEKSDNNEQINNHINDLLLQAERAIGMDRLTAPIEDNAYSYYQKVLGLDALNDDAKIGLDEIAKRYLAKAQDQFDIGNSQAAEALLQRARFVSPRFVQAHEINTYDSRHHISEDEAIGLNMGNVQVPAQESAPVETIKAFDVVEANRTAEPKSLSVLPNAGWKDEQLAQHAQELIKQNKHAEAQLALKNFIAQEKAPVLSATLLADLYIRQGNTQAAGIIADQASYLPVDIKTKINAQIFSANNDDAQAIAILEKNLAAAENNEAYRSLLASLYHKIANYQQSITSYQRLLTRFGDRPAYWLGLALAYDGLLQHQNALQAYLRLREFPQLQEQVILYTDQRVAALRSD